jgi:hypothetical protein
MDVSDSCAESWLDIAQMVQHGLGTQVIIQN